MTCKTERDMLAQENKPVPIPAFPYWWTDWELEQRSRMC
jgi:hypothetical protein